MKTLLVGNGININFASNKSNYLNKSIMNRFILNLMLFEGDFDGFSLLSKIKNKLDNFCDNKYFYDTKNKNHLEILKRIKSFYINNRTLTSIGMEDFLLLVELELIDNHYSTLRVPEDKNEEIILEQMLDVHICLLSAIYNDGNIQTNYLNFPKNLLLLFNKYDKIFTVNYDNNIELFMKKYNSKIDNIYHLHGDFSKESIPRLYYIKTFKPYTISDDELKNAFTQEYGLNNLINKMMNLSILKYINGSQYNIDDFKNISGEIDIVGLSCCNDDHIFDFLNKNVNLTKIKYYFYSTTNELSIDEKLQIERLLNNQKDKIEFLNVTTDLWNKYE